MDRSISKEKGEQYMAATVHHTFLSYLKRAVADNNSNFIWPLAQAAISPTEGIISNQLKPITALGSYVSATSSVRCRTCKILLLRPCHTEYAVHLKLYNLGEQSAFLTHQDINTICVPADGYTPCFPPTALATHSHLFG